jgi:hypothetical protein
MQTSKLWLTLENPKMATLPLYQPKCSCDLNDRAWSLLMFVSLQFGAFSALLCSFLRAKVAAAGFRRASSSSTALGARAWRFCTLVRSEWAATEMLGKSQKELQGRNGRLMPGLHRRSTYLGRMPKPKGPLNGLLVFSFLRLRGSPCS